ncbi:MAG: translation initiation factor IF-6 [Thermoplasmata archaeon]|nr:translation initiation factor IF-6 [Thermoplasmata archaeon]MCI4342189.1 translation initiation factor IF-6 [Thermoplasmata archaeon]
MPVARALYSGSPYLGVYLRAGETHALLPVGAPTSLQRDLERALGVQVVRSRLLESDLLGSLCVFNRRGLIVGDQLEEEERASLSRVAPVTELEIRQNAIGNVVLANDRGALVHPEVSDVGLARISAALGVPAERGTIAGLGTVGMAAVATEKGVVVHPRTTESEAAVVERLFGVPVHRSTANFGVPVVGACLVANSRGLLFGIPTTPVEIVHLQEGFSVYD